MSNQITIFEMGPRDGLQNEKNPIPASDKICLVDLLSEAGLTKIEAASFVSPRWVPQMGDGDAVMTGITRRIGVRYTALTPNLKGYMRAKAAGADEVAIFAAASESFSRANLNRSRADALAMFAEVAEAARSDRMPLRAYVSCVTDCPFDGAVPPADVAWTTEALLKMGAYEVSLGDTIGHGTPDTIADMLDAVLAIAPAEKLAGHYHDTKNRALENILVSVERGLRVFDAAVGGLGGCPFAPGAKGNVATEAVAAMLDEEGLETGLDFDRLAKAAAYAGTLRSAP